MSDKIQQIVEMVESLTVLELNGLVKTLEEKFGVTAAAPVAVAVGPATAVAEVEEKTEFNLILASAGDKKINVIKVVRELTNGVLGLKEAKELVDGAPKVVLENVEKNVAEAAKAKLEEVGATVEIK